MLLAQEVSRVARTLAAVVHPDAQLIFGASVSADAEDEIVVTAILTGFEPPPDDTRLDLFAFKPATPLISVGGNTGIGSILDIGDGVRSVNAGPGEGAVDMALDDE